LRSRHQPSGVGAIRQACIHAGFDRFHDAHRTAHPHEPADECRSHERFADTRVGTCHKHARRPYHAYSVSTID